MENLQPIQEEAQPIKPNTKSLVKTWIWDILIACIAGMIVGVAYYFFQNSNGFAPGGVGGLATITHHLTKVYWALVCQEPTQKEKLLEGMLWRNEKQNKSYICRPGALRKDAKLAKLKYCQIGKTDRYFLLEVELMTGRHHQIRCQLSSIGCPIKGDLKYGAQRSNPDGSISLHARYIEFIHPVSKEQVQITAPVPNDRLWQSFEK